MRHKCLPDVAVPDYDEKISKAMKAAAYDGGGHDMLIAVENHEGRVYRVFATSGLSEYIGAVGKFQRLGMKDKLENRPTSSEGYDSRFHF
ncbi:hypothetical protein [Chromobacterium sp. Beijing]|uniref:hypothetical protein n=1 Tax=Chromobacterium sp. Beijing TaxID=2735795 RepID=UPI001F34C940|nr:hypothetical protein [Chromobacterium sp. Beijing]UJB33734.1 hypothetical protein HQN78_23320 [Chromobacterium sp. Beijing]